MSLVTQLTEYLRADKGWISGAALERVAWTKKNGAFYKSSNISRRLRELAEEGTIFARGNPVEYSFNVESLPKKREAIIENGVMRGYRLI